MRVGYWCAFWSIVLILAVATMNNSSLRGWFKSYSPRIVENIGAAEAVNKPNSAFERAHYLKILPSLFQRWENTSHVGAGVSLGRNFCSHHEIMPGSWKIISSNKRVDSSYASYHCCTMAPTSTESSVTARFCEATDTTNSHGGDFQGRSTTNTIDIHGCTGCDESLGAKLKQALLDWMPSSGCTISSWDAHRFCLLLGNRSMVLIGDSTMRQSATTLVNLINEGFDGSEAQPCSNQIHFSLSDTLVLDHFDAIPGGLAKGDVERGTSVVAVIKRLQPDIAVLSAGPHIFQAEHYRDLLLQLTAILNTSTATLQAKRLKVVWKTINPGHDHCARKVLRLEYFSSLTDIHYGETDKFNWFLHPVFDEIALNTFGKRGWPIIDMRPLYYRSDAHRFFDCLHYCAPGPLVLFARQLLTLFEVGEV